MFLHFQLLFKNKRKLTYRKTNHRKSKLLLQESTNIDNDYSKNKKTHIKYYLLQSPNVIYLFGHIVFVKKKTLS